jgi:enoyl-CoA hydratase/carnithine racemase
MSQDDVLIERDGGVAIITLNRPARRNTLTDGMLEILRTFLAGIEDDASVGAVVLTGTGPLFCGGFDVSGGPPRSGRQAFQAHADLASRTLWGIWKSRLPFVAAVRGLCLGGGVYLAGVCDFLLTTDGTRFSMGEIKFGFAPPLFNLFPWLMGLRAAKEFLMTGDPITGARAVEMGLANRTVPDERLASEAMDLARSLAKMPDGVVRTIKRSVNARWELAGFVTGIERDVEAFVENKVFQGRVQAEYRRLAREIGGRAALERLGIDLGLGDLDAAP